MKNFLILCVLSISTIVFSQKREKGTLELAPQVGAATSNYYGSNVVNNSSITALNFGVGADYFFNDRWSLRSGILYQTMGTEFVGYTEELKYITIPINANWHFGSNRKWNLNFGPQIGFNTSAKGNGINLKEFVEPIQYGLNIGIGYKIAVTEKFSILLDYQSFTGLSKVDKTGQNLKNSTGVFNIGGVFKL